MVLSTLPLCGSADEKPFTLWYDKPATRFEEALPLGNGSIGVMVYGNPDNEILNLNSYPMGRRTDKYQSYTQCSLVSA